MDRKKITLNDLPQIRKAQTSSRAANSGVKGTKDNPYSEDEALSLIDKGKFKGGYVEDKDGLVSYWLGEAEVIAYNSASEEDFIFDFNSDFYKEFCNNYYGSDSYPFGTSESSVSSPCVNETVSDVVGAVNTAGDALEHNPKKINYGSNGKFYFETKSGRVFCGNQYIGTTSVNGIGKLITTYVGKIDIALKVYDIGATYYDEGLEDGNKKLATSVGGEAGAWLGRLAFAELGVKFGSAVGVWAGPAGPAIGGVIGGIIGAVGGEAVGSFLVEIAIE